MQRRSIIVTFSTSKQNCRYCSALLEEVKDHNNAVAGYVPSRIKTLNWHGVASLPIAVVGTDCTLRSRFLPRRLAVIDGMIAVAEGLGDLSDPDHRTHTLNVLFALEIGVRVAIVGKLGVGAADLLGEKQKGRTLRWRQAANVLKAIDFATKPSAFDDRPIALPESIDFVLGDASPFHGAAINDLPIYPNPPKPLGSEGWCDNWASQQICFIRSGLLAAIVDGTTSDQDATLSAAMKGFIQANVDGLRLMAGSEAVQDMENAISAVIDSLVENNKTLLTDDHSTDEIELKRVLLTLLGHLVAEDSVEVIKLDSPSDQPKPEYGYALELDRYTTPIRPVKTEANRKRITIARTSSEALHGELCLTKSDLAPLYEAINRAQAIVSQRFDDDTT